jgi:hypothetical protein
MDRLPVAATRTVSLDILRTEPRLNPDNVRSLMCQTMIAFHLLCRHVGLP